MASAAALWFGIASRVNPGRIVSMRPDPVRLQVFHQLLAAVCDESGALLQRSAISPNIRERRDFSVALFDARARLIAQARTSPCTWAAPATRCAPARARSRSRAATSRSSTIRSAAARTCPTSRSSDRSFGGARPAYFAISRAHHADFGGGVPGSMAWPKTSSAKAS